MSRVQKNKKPNKREFFKNIALDTINILQTNQKYKVNGIEIDISQEIEDCVDGTILYQPGASFESRIHPLQNKRRGHIELKDETTLHAAIRLSKDLKIPQDEIVVLNYASARNPGGGFDTGANAQEESIARQTSLISSITQTRVREMYDYNRKEKSLLYSDYMIYTPGAVIFRDDNEEYMQEPSLTSIITCPAANLTNSKKDGNIDEIHKVMLNRCRKIIQVAILNENTAIVLGAFGCGVFHNDPYDVANYFKTILIDENYKDFFDEIVFAIVDESSKNFNAFKEVFQDLISSNQE